MTPLREVSVPPLALRRLEPIIGSQRLQRLADAARRVDAAMGERVLWNVNSTAAGGGVAEMLQVLVGYAAGAGIDARWLVIDGDEAFFAITKRLHHRFHGMAGDVGPLGEAEVAHYTRIAAANAPRLTEMLRPGDVVLLHDPQTAGLTAACAQAGAAVVWRCHIGANVPNEHTAAAWDFVRPHLERADAFIFSRQEYIPPWVPPERGLVIPPSIDPLAPKNQPMDADVVAAILQRSGVVEGTPAVTPAFTRRDGTAGEVTRGAQIVGAGPIPLDVPVVLQVSRWDPLKDMGGVMAGFAATAQTHDAHLALVGPTVLGVTDDPEGERVLTDCIAQRAALPAAIRDRVLLVSLPMDDVDENAAMVNALQRHAAVVVQKSLAEGFGLTVAEAMWKGRPVIASAAGGIPDQIGPGTGVLLDDPGDLAGFGQALATLLTDDTLRGELGAMAQEHVRAHFVGDLHLIRYADLLLRLVGAEH